MRLEPGEHVIVRTRAHPRVLRGAAAVLVGTAFALGLLMGLIQRPGLPAVLAGIRPQLETVVWVAASVCVLLGTLRPLLRWATGATVLTSRRLVRRPGLGAGRSAAMPLVAIADVQRRRRGSGAGDLHVLFQEPLRQVYWRLADVPEAERFENVLAEATRAARGRAWPPVPAAGGAR